MRVAAIQTVSSADVVENFGRLSELLEQAVADNAKLIVLPENFLCFSSSFLSDKQTHHYLQQLRDFSRASAVAIVAGTIPLSLTLFHYLFPEKKHLYQEFSGTEKRLSASIFIGPAGELFDHYCKRHLFDADVLVRGESDAHALGADSTLSSPEIYRESDRYLAGELLGCLPRIDDELYCISLAVCYDLRFPEYFQQLKSLGSGLVCVPSAFTAKTGAAHWEVLLRARAIETQSYFVAANQGGCHGGDRETWGHSMIIDPWGEVLACIARGEGVICADIDFRRVTEVRGLMPLDKHRRSI